MAEQRTGEGVREQGPEGRGEILNFQNYGGLYGRFLMASLPGAKIDNIIDPANKTVDFFNLTDDALKGRNYNLVAEKSSIAERKNEWGTTPYLEAKAKWREQFTTHMKGITDWKQESALKIVMPELKKAEEFTEDNADTLFEKFCDGGRSDIDMFIRQVTVYVASSSGKIDPAYLKELLPHLQWIASGLFGKNTASQVVTRLIELESALQNDFGQVMEIFNSNKERINNPTDDEKRVLGLLHDSLRPQEKRGPTQGIPVITADIPKPAPVTKSDEEKDEQLEIKPPPSPPPTEKTKESAEGHVDTITPEETEEIGEMSSFTDLLRWQHGKYEIRIKKYSDSWQILFNMNRESVDNSYLLSLNNFDLATALKEFEDKGLEPGAAEKIYQSLAKSFLNGIEVKDQVCLDLLKNFPSRTIDLDGKQVSTEAFWGWGQDNKLHYLLDNREELDQNAINKLSPQAIHSLNVTIGKAVLEAWIKNSPTPAKSDLAPTAPTGSTPEKNIIRIPENITDPADFRERLNDYLIQNQNEPRITFSFSTDQLKKYLTSMAEGYDVRSRIIEANEKGDEITISDLRITKLGMGVTLDLVLGNDKDGIMAKITKFKRDLMARGNKTSSREEVERQIENINSSIKIGLNQQIDIRNDSWSAEKISIADGKVRVEFEKSPVAKAPIASETFESEVTAEKQEPKAQVEVTTISENDYERLVNLKIRGRKSKIVWKQDKREGKPREGGFHLEDFRDAKGALTLPNGTLLSIGTWAIRGAPFVIISGGKNTEISINDLRYFKERDLSINLITNALEFWKDKTDFEESGKAIFRYVTGFRGEQAVRGLSVKEAIDRLKAASEEEKT